MSIIKSFSVGDGDMFYVNHNSENFTIIDSCMDENNKYVIVDELIRGFTNKEIIRFISTHPDEDHIQGLEYLDSKINILNFYCVKNEATKKIETADFKKYCELRDSKDKAFYIYKGCSRQWMNQEGVDKNGKHIGNSGISILWPDINNQDFKDALNTAKEGGNANNISPIIQYGLENGITALWMGDLETEFMDKIKNNLSVTKIDVLFAPHHGRKTGKVPAEILKILNPSVIIVGEADSEYLDYYKGYNTITQNTAGNIILDCDFKKIHFYASNYNYSVKFLYKEIKNDYNYYLGTLNL